jgi:hypothetical protein
MTFPPWELENEMWAMWVWFEDRTERILDAMIEPAIDTPTIALGRVYTAIPGPL